MFLCQNSLFYWPYSKKRVQMYNNLPDFNAESEIFFFILQQNYCFTAYALVFK